MSVYRTIGPLVIIAGDVRVLTTYGPGMVLVSKVYHKYTMTTFIYSSVNTRVTPEFKMTWPYLLVLFCSYF